MALVEGGGVGAGVLEQVIGNAHQVSFQVSYDGDNSARTRHQAGPHGPRPEEGRNDAKFGVTNPVALTVLDVTEAMLVCRDWCGQEGCEE